MNWTSVITKLVSVLEAYQAKVANVTLNDIGEEDSVESITVVCSIFQFLVKLLRAAKDKRLFVAYDVS